MFFYRETTHAGVTNTFGINSESSPILQNINILLEAVSPIFTGLRDNIEKFLNTSPDSPLIPQLRAERIRANELAPVIEIDMGIPSVDADFALNFERQSVSKRRWLTLAILVIMCLILSTVSIATPFTIGIIFYYLWTQKNHVYMSDTTTHMTFPDGVYNINWKILGATTKVGIAVVYRGVMHVPYHVSGNSPMEIEGRECQVTYCSPERDLTTYGGLPMFENIQDGEDVYINLENNNRRTKKTTALVTDNGIAFRHYTTPGESGSPVWTKTPEGDLKLVGQAGRWIGCGGEKAEFIVRDTSEPETPPCPTPQITSEFEKGIKKIITHPGSGKTRTVIPQLIESHMQQRLGKFKRVIVLGPTRVVCRELYAALESRFGPTVSLHIKGYGKSGFGNIAIMAHHTYLEMYERESPEVRKATCIIVDEAHADDYSTKAIKQITTYLSETTPVAWLSATLDGECDDGSNYPIKNIRCQEHEIMELAIKLYNEGKRVAIFCPSVMGDRGVYKVASDINITMMSAAAVALCRETMEDVYSRKIHKSSEPIIIATTNISEMGANLNLDAVIDYGTEFKFVDLQGTIMAKTRPIGTASYVQRRGRVRQQKLNSY